MISRSGLVSRNGVVSCPCRIRNLCTGSLSRVCSSSMHVALTVAREAGRADTSPHRFEIEWAILAVCAAKAAKPLLFPVSAASRKLHVGALLIDLLVVDP